MNATCSVVTVLQVVGLKIRCALITTVYQKVLSVSNVLKSKFNSGEIINFMSTDTDRIVNFCLSFHAFWSLPFQIGVSLFLLYQQVRRFCESKLFNFVYLCCVTGAKQNMNEFVKFDLTFYY